jgi:hypothetical protein
MKTYRYVIVGLGMMAMVFPSVAWAANWVRYSTDRQGSIYYYDSESLRESGSNIVRIWIRIDYSNNRSERAREAKHLISLNCAESTFALLSYITYDAQGNITSSRNIPSYAIQYSPIIPESIAESLSNVLCRA